MDSRQLNTKDWKPLLGKLVKATCKDPITYTKSETRPENMELANLTVTGKLMAASKEKLVIITSWYDDGCLDGNDATVFPTTTVTQLKELKE